MINTFQTEQQLFNREKLIEERERKVREQEINLINNFKIIVSADSLVY